MSKIIMLGTGNGMTMDIYNTCFVIQNEKGNFLIDTGGSIEIVKRLYELDIKLNDIENIFISHSHTDHIFGLFWIFREFYRQTKAKNINNNINIYCNEKVLDAIKTIMNCVFDKKVIDVIEEKINFIKLNDNDKYNINGVEYTFFDLNAKKIMQYGFQCEIENKKLIFLGDETLKNELYKKIKNADYVMHEAFCLESEENIFKPQEKGHSSALKVAETMNNLYVKNLILYHTEETHKEKRKELYEIEAQSIFNGNVIVPNDLEIIEIKEKTYKK